MGLVVGASAADRVWLIGGGPDVYGSQAQIELNTLWAREVISRLPGERDVRTWFDDGDDPAPDVSEWRMTRDGPPALQTLSRVMGSHWANGLIYRNHRLPDVAGGTRSDLLVGQISEQIEGLGEQDTVWLLFNGHGRHQADLNNTIELWNRTRLHVNDLVTLLDRVPARTRLRFLFTQCYAGAFAKLAVPGSNRCGFVAEAEDRQAEGCSAAIESQDFQDYSTHFFAALAGSDRAGVRLPRSPDRDRDGRVSPLEAHYHTLLTAHNADIPRATSEVLLEQWRPWFQPLAALLVPDRQTVYSELAQELMAAAGIEDGKALRRRREQFQLQYQGLKAELQGLADDQLERVRGFLEDELLKRWPVAGYPYTQGYARFLATDLTAAQAFISSRPEYARLVLLEHKHQDLELRLLELERDMAELDKIRHLLDLGQALSMLRAMGSEAMQQRYGRLVDCESAPF
jgi:hypothetical protein